jgi:hypothetical protein
MTGPTAASARARSDGGMRFLTLKYRGLRSGWAALAALIAEETGAGANDVEPWAAAGTPIGVRRALDDRTRRRMLAGVLNPGLAREAGSRGNHAMTFRAAGSRIRWLT